MSRLSLRSRIALAAAASVGLAAALLGAVVVILVGRDLHDSLDRTLRQRAREVAQLSATTPALLKQPGALEAPISGAQLLVEVLDSRGRVVARSPALGSGAPVLPASIASGGRGVYRDLELREEPLRAYVAPLAATGGPVSGGSVVVAAATGDITSTLARLRRLVVLAALAAAAVGAGAGLLATPRALSPLRALSAGAADIERTRDSSRRLPEPPTRDELATLARTLNRMLDALERARAAERRFVDDASHELRTPLTALRGNAAYVARHGGDQAALQALEADADRLSRLVDDLLALAREDASPPPMERVRLDALAREVTAGETGVVLHADAAIEVRGDAAALGRALRNLIENAHTHGPLDGRIEVEVASVDGNAVVSVSDEGGGIPAADADRAVQRFWRAPEARSRPGSGLGLAIAQAAAERHGGRVEVDGARISIVLPLSLSDVSQAPSL